MGVVFSVSEEIKMGETWHASPIGLVMGKEKRGLAAGFGLHTGRI